MLLKKVSYARQDCIYLIKNTVKALILIFLFFFISFFIVFLQFKMTIYYLKIFLNVIYSCDAKLNFQNQYSSLQCHKIL